MGLAVLFRWELAHGRYGTRSREATSGQGLPASGPVFTNRLDLLSPSAIHAHKCWVANKGDHCRGARARAMQLARNYTAYTASSSLFPRCGLGAYLSATRKRIRSRLASRDNTFPRITSHLTDLRTPLFKVSWERTRLRKNPVREEAERAEIRGRDARADNSPYAVCKSKQCYESGEPASILARFSRRSRMHRKLWKRKLSRNARKVFPVKS